ncbi:MAG: DUF3857 domain-containing protein [Ignavibacteriales bacterium]
MKNANLRLVILILLFFVAIKSEFASEKGNSGDEIYNVSSLNSGLRSNADAVIRNKTVTFEVKNERRAVQKVRQAVTIFNKNGQHYGELVLWYDKFIEIEDLEGKLFDANGKEIRELGSSELQDVSAFSENTLYGDTRVKVAELYFDKYPYTVEYTYEISYDGYLNWPSWWSQETLDPVEHSRFEVLAPGDQELRFWCNRDSIHPVVSIDGSKKHYLWEANNLPLLSKDIIGDDIDDIATVVRIAPSRFEIEDYSGSMKSWKDFGLWYRSLIKDRDILPKNAIDDIRKIINTDDSEHEKVAKLYRYMQSRTRYISVQLGIGSWRPYDASYVHERGYGDCKALCNYMSAILKEAGIQSFPVLINSGDHQMPLINEFPSNQFNHAILCVPLKQDTIWLECTSQTIATGHLSWATENRTALMITPEGGILVQVPASISRQNVQQRNITAKINPTGSLNAEGSVKWSGDQQDYVRNELVEATPEERERWVTSSLEVPEARLESYKMTGLETREPEIKMSVGLFLPKYASQSGKRMFFQPNLMERRTSVPRDVVLRVSPVRVKYPYYDVDSVYYNIPAGYAVEAIPAEVNLASSFGNFNSKTRVMNDTLIVYTRMLEIKAYSVPALNYAEYRQFFADVVKSDRAQIVLVKKSE